MPNLKAVQRKQEFILAHAMFLYAYINFSWTKTIVIDSILHSFFQH